jgi:hypothetical protein
LRGRIIANKTAELTDFMKSAVGLVKSYVPPDPTKIQAAKDAGKVSIDVLEPGKRAQINFRDYQKPGDNLGVQIDLAGNLVLGLKVSSYLDNLQDIVMLNVSMGQMNDGTSYASDVTLNAPSEESHSHGAKHWLSEDELTHGPKIIILSCRALRTRPIADPARVLVPDDMGCRRASSWPICSTVTSSIRRCCRS